MYYKQHTIQKTVSVSGVGLHTGKLSTMTFLPAPSNHGFKFKRIDLEGQPIVEADADLVVDVSRGTTIEQNGARVYTVEHTLAALVGLQIDNVLIEIDGPEPPILDGSSVEFLKVLKEAGLQEQDAPRNFFYIPENISYEDANRGVKLSITPAYQYNISVTVDYNSDVLGVQKADLQQVEDFAEQIAPCRTFCFLHEVEMLYKGGLIKGGDLCNAIVIVDKVMPENELNELAQLLGKPKVEVNSEGILDNVELHYPNEPARHKLLDVVGDLALVGRPIVGKIEAIRPGHAANVELAKKIKQAIKNEKKGMLYNPDSPTVLDASQIEAMLPHRFPFLLIDKVIHLDNETVIAVKNVSMNEWYFQGHFPKNPVMPGVLQVEGLAQAGGIFALSTVEDPENYWTYFLRIDECRFHQKIIPGDTILYHCTLITPIKRGIVKMDGKAYVNGKLVCEAKLTASITRKND
ncbi:MAG: bifunctional UDP-3-O-[3-hydroxymyristoyl] N-acetylglucosamine deacetylase/3-hydroxyacyl-ACP dehydratase [Thermonemataceae bacterium]|nr:bifunctional UDP-3-O-[3-hydroxymyristoyl] N-acetylglucosamine deacetylase/3-hydroxyacyl-ACP dehydratase [Thermonemataceae bacterium]